MKVDGTHWNQPMNGSGSNIMLEPHETAMVQLCGLVVRVEADEETYVRVLIDVPDGSDYPHADDGLPLADVVMGDEIVRGVITWEMVEEARRVRACMSAVSAVPTNALRQAVARVLAAAEGTGSGEVVEQLRALVRDART